MNYWEQPLPPAAAPCTCDKCKKMCEMPCWPLPEEAAAIEAAGFGDRLMRDWWVKVSREAGGRTDTSVYCPASKGYEGMDAPEWGMWELGDPRRVGCTFHTEAGLCMLHSLGLKPLEGRAAECPNRAAASGSGAAASGSGAESIRDYIRKQWEERPWTPNS